MCFFPFFCNFVANYNITMPIKTTNKRNLGHRLMNIMRANISLVNIIAAALLVELVSGVMYYSAQNIIHKTVERLVDREMNAIYLCIRNKLAKVEVTVDNMAWVVSDGLEEPDWMFSITRRIVENNPSFRGSGIAFMPNYYPQKGRFFEPYSVRREDGTVESMQLGKDNEDYTTDEYYRVPATQGIAHWSEPYQDPDGANAIVTTYGVPVRNANGKTVGVAYVDISLDRLEDVMEESKVYKTTQRFLVTGDGNLVAGKNNAMFQLALEQVKTDKDKAGHIILKDENGNEHHVFFHPIGGMTDWILINILDDNDVFSKLRRIRTNLLLLVLSGLVLIGFIVWRTTRSLQRLREANAEKERISGELRVASQIQQSMLPTEDVKSDWLEVRGCLKPAREVGGDLYDYFIRDEKLFFCIGDVSGKGAPSAMVMSVIHSLFRAFSAHENNPARIMQAINEASCRGNDSCFFVTIFIGVLDLPTGLLRYCDAGHDCPLIIENGELRTENCNPHLPVGVFDEVNYKIQERQLASDSTIFLYTDGLTEAMNSKHEQFGMERVEAVVGSCIDKQPKDILDTVIEAVHGFVKDAEQSDDLTMMSIHYTSKQFESILSETLALKNNLQEVSKLSSFIKSVLENLEIDKSLGSQLRLAIEEAVVNVIEYAYPTGTEGDIELQMMSDGKNLKTVIIDSGVRFDPTRKEKADLSIPVEERPIGGLGILLVRELMDSINYERINHQNILTLIKKYN